MLLLGGYYLGSTFTSKEKVIERFEEALEEQNTTALAGMVDSTDPNLKISEKSLFPFISYIEENLQNLSFSVLEKSGFVNIHQTGKRWLFFDNYKISIKSFYPVISANYDGTEIYTKNNQMIRWIDSNRNTIDINSSKVNQEYKNCGNFWVNQILSSVD